MADDRDTHAVLPTPPSPPDVTWRALRAADVDALCELQLACAQVYGNRLEQLTDYAPALRADGDPTTNATICAVRGDGTMLAVGWARLELAVEHELRALLAGDVHPALRRRGLGSFLLRWTESQGRRLAATQSRQLPVVLRIEGTDRRDDALPLYARAGFSHRYTEHILERDLASPMPDVALPEGVQLLPWTAERATTFFAVHEDAWTTRPAGPRLHERAWIAYWSGDDGFRPDLSHLAIDATGHGVGFILCDVDEPAAVGWITKLGVRPTARGHGLGAALLTRTLRDLQRLGLRRAALDVGADNPTARRLYARLGFAEVGQRTLWAKELDGQSAAEDPPADHR